METSLRVSTSGGRDQPTDMARLTQGAPGQSPEAEGGPSLTGHVSNYKGNPWEMTNVFISRGYGALLPLPKPLLPEDKYQEINQASWEWNGHMPCLFHTSFQVQAGSSLLWWAAMWTGAGPYY